MLQCPSVEDELVFVLLLLLLSYISATSRLRNVWHLFCEFLDRLRQNGTCGISYTNTVNSVYFILGRFYPAELPDGKSTHWPKIMRIICLDSQACNCGALSTGPRGVLNTEREEEENHQTSSPRAAIPRGSWREERKGNNKDGWVETGNRGRRGNDQGGGRAERKNPEDIKTAFNGRC